MSGMLSGVGGFLGKLFGGGGGGDIMGILNAINQLTGGKIEGSKSVPFVPGGLGMADKNWQQLYGQMTDQLLQNPQLAQQMQQYLQQGQAGIPGVQGQLQGLSGMTPQLMQGLLGQAGQMQGLQGQLGQAGQQAWQTAQDPQGALRARLMNEVGQTSAANTSMRGIGMGPQAAGLQTEAQSKFGQDWENQQLQRQLAGLQGMGGAFGTAGQLGQQYGRDVTGAMQMGALGPQFMQAAAGYPFDIMNQYSGAMGQGVYQPWLAGMGAAIPYMNAGIGATGQNFAAGQTGLANLGYSLGNLGNMFQGQQQPYGGGGGSQPWSSDYGQYF